MNELQTQTTQLPDTLEDLNQFVLVGKAKLQAYMLKLQTVNKLSVAQEIRDQTLKEAQEVSTAVIAAEQRIGELLLAIPKATGNQYTSANSTQTEKAKTKSETVSKMGYSKDEASDYQQMAKHPEVVQRVIDTAISNGDVVTKSQVLKEIKAAKEQARAEAEASRSTREKFEKARADRLQAEVSALKDMEPKTVEVVPSDYETLKRQKASYEQENKMLLSAKRRDADEIQKLKARLADLESRKDMVELQKKLEQEAGYFAIRTYDYIQKNGGYVWITERMKDLGPDSRKQFVNAVYAIDAFAKQMVENIGGYGIE